MIYDVIITESLQRTVVVESSDPTNAEIMVRKRYSQEDIVLGDVDFQGVQFKIHGHKNGRD